MEVVFDHCESGLSVQEEILSKKAARIRANDPRLLRRLLGRQCAGGRYHYQLEDGHIARKSQVPPPSCVRLSPA
eukprot:3494345-Pyramimonas_sp.AAC.1